ncbi:Flp pilus assembly protein CpaB [Psychromonas hadalis]|uniref:Flp pilus assembly protein CpaB n=1 Tax=Psychromonas hadalis TaxID=211669 RepID=UPI0003B78489|nr:Flp pilus assembly protein CpaB [Psychromonas hadalis]
MNKNTLFFIVLSITFGLGAVFIANNWLQASLPEVVVAGKVTVFSVNVDLPRGTLLDAKYIVAKLVPEEMLAKGVITERSQLENMVVKQKLFEGDILKLQRLVKKGEGNSFASLLGKNKRAISIRVNDVVGVSGFLLPGNRVDVLNTYHNSSKKVITDVILSNIKIIAIDQKASDDENKPQLVRAVTLEVDLREAAILLSARNKGSINLALRNPNDHSNPAGYLLDTKVKTENAERVISEDKNSSSTDIILASSSVKISPPRRYKIRTKIEIIRGIKQQSVLITEQ